MEEVSCQLKAGCGKPLRGLSAVAAALALQVQCDRVQRVERELALSRDVSSGLRGLERLVPMICRCVQARKSAI